MIYNEMEKQNLYEDYVIKNLSQKEMIQKYNITIKTLNRKLAFYNIKKVKVELISKDNLQEMYITQNKSIDEIVTETGVSYNSIRFLIKKYGIKKDSSLIQKTRENSNLQKYGTKYASSIEDVKEKIKKTCQEKYGSNSPLECKEIQEKIKATNLEKYGDALYVNTADFKTKKDKTFMANYGTTNIFSIPEIQNKIKATNIERYGTEHPEALPEFIEKRKQTSLKKYGVEYPSQSDIVKHKIFITNLEKYGKNCVLSSDAIKQKIIDTNLQKYGTLFPAENKNVKNKMAETCMEKYNVEWPCLTDNCINGLTAKESKPNLEFANMLSDNNIEYSREYRIANRSYDFKVGNTLIEINPTATHNSIFGVHGKEPLDKNYHLYKSKLANTNNFSCIHVFDWDDKNKIINMLAAKNKIYARQCDIHFVENKDADEFLYDHHLQGTCSGQKILLGLYYNEELVELMTFGKPRYNKNYQYELLRLCTKSGFSIIGGASKLFKKFLLTYKPESIISYCDNSKFSGGIYTTLGFNMKSYGQPTCHWYNIRTGRHITDNLLRQRGFDQLFKTNYGKEKTNNELMLANGFVQVYDCGQSTFIWKSENLK